MPDSNSQSLREACLNKSLLAERFRLLVESVRDYAIFLLDPEGHIATWNLGAQSIKGYQANEIIGKHFSVFYTREDIERKHPQNELKLALANGHYEEEGWRLRKDGSRFWANIVITPLRDEQGQLLGFSKVTRDLTERQIAEEKLRESEERYRLLVEGVKDYAIFMLDPNGQIITWNEGARRLQGYESDEIIGRNFEVFYPPEEIKSGKCHQLLQLAQSNGQSSDEGWRIRKDGSRFWATVTISALYDKHGKLYGFSKITRDITAKKRADDDLLRAYATMEQQVQERTRELEQAVHLRDEFLSIASHELRTPITVLKLQLHILKSKNSGRQNWKSLTEEDLTHALNISTSQVDRLAALIDALLDVSRLQAGRMTLDLKPLDFCKLVNDAVTQLEPQLQASRCTITIQATAPLPICADALRIEQVIINLLTNAMKYAAGKPIEIQLLKLDGKVRLQVKDLGMGIAPKDHERIFERFERAVSHVNISGFGVGLYIAKTIVEAHKGNIFVESQMGEGATFVVELPSL